MKNVELFHKHQIKEMLYILNIEKVTGNVKSNASKAETGLVLNFTARHGIAVTVIMTKFANTLQSIIGTDLFTCINANSVCVYS